MQTYSHFILTAALNRLAKRLKRELNPPLASRSLLVGSVLPDAPLTLIAIYTIIHDFVVGEKPGLTKWLFDEAFFHNPWIKTAHNLFHGPIPIAVYIGVGFLIWKLKAHNWARILFWLGIGCAIHTIIDIPLHYNDGPLLLFPFDFETRFYSPVSYWDPAHYGMIAAPLEHLLVLGVLVWLIIDWRRRRNSAAL